MYRVSWIFFGFWAKNKARFVVLKFVVVFLVICPFCLVIIDTSTFEHCAVAINISISHSPITCLLYMCPEIGDTVIKGLFWTSEYNRTNKCLKCIHASFEDIEISSLFPWYELRQTHVVYALIRETDRPATLDDYLAKASYSYH